MRRILVLAANPVDTSQLQLAKEVHDIKEGLLRSRHRDEFEFLTEWTVTARGLRRALLDHQPEFIHFSGHGNQRGISLEDESGATQRVSTEALAELFARFSDHLRCVLLNSCDSQPQAEAISQGIPYAIGMRGKVADEAAVEFAVGFYDAVGAGRTIDDAFALGCNAIHNIGLPDHSRPVLYRQRADNVEPAAEEHASPVPGKAAPPPIDQGHERPPPENKERAHVAPFFQFLQTALRLGLQSGGRRFAPRIVGAGLYSAVVALLITTLFWLREPEVQRIAFFVLALLGLLIVVLIILPDLNPYVGNFLATVVILGLVGAIVWGAYNIAKINGPPAPGPTRQNFDAMGRIRFEDGRPAEGVAVSIPLLRLSDRTNANGTFSLGEIDYLPGKDTVDLQIAVNDTVTVFRRRIALNAESFDIVLAYQPPPELPVPTVASPGPDTTRPDQPSQDPPEPEAVRRPQLTSGVVAGYVNAAIGGEQYKHFGMNVTGSGTCRLRGRVQVLRGGNRDVHVVVLTAEEFEPYKVKGPYSEIFRERNTSDYTLDVELPGPGRYELVVSNRTSWLTPKYVLVENVRWECSGAAS
ncbi:CHAT domain-containing protein [Longimicrobium terrae]|uniref:Putative membrane protein YeaQ/YmgE (Transglycosylase-associated protein family) n=1 Tax=Longimicrobium terrae TaxID=1639882 RepID=A0A841GX14_9BACT|nr:CHAT domain-containing protein [Longimicrobium terrae]MBB4634811.1 hypothetical protein [Longimicrobium terrae]MBB6069206.1 putative membrane protein YeaQ/YmgE (transglycosylase-associated protein family) [Longimicrobium terrae]NNC31982.1 CHAT domain-containing protein [Longimicrobium terrae]